MPRSHEGQESWPKDIRPSSRLLADTTLELNGSERSLLIRRNPISRQVRVPSRLPNLHWRCCSAGAERLWLIQLQRLLTERWNIQGVQQVNSRRSCKYPRSQVAPRLLPANQTQRSEGVVSRLDKTPGASSTAVMWPTAVRVSNVGKVDGVPEEICLFPDKQAKVFLISVQHPSLNLASIKKNNKLL